MVVQARQPLRDRHWQDAGRLLRERGLREADHQAMQENLATYLAHRSDDQLSERWQAKLERELEQPYTDTQVEQRLDQLQNHLKTLLDDLPAYPSQLYLTGSFSRGRLGANSDLDAHVILKPEHLKAGFDSFETNVGGSQACLIPFSEHTPGLNRGTLLAVGASVQVEPKRIAEPGYLRQVYRHVQEQRSQRKETSQLFEWLTGKVWGEELTPYQKRVRMEEGGLTHHAMALAGTLAGVPWINSLVSATADLLVRQSHL